MNDFFLFFLYGITFAVQLFRNFGFLFGLFTNQNFYFSDYVFPNWVASLIK